MTTESTEPDVHSLVFSDFYKTYYTDGTHNHALDFSLSSKYFSASAPDLGFLPPVVRYVSPWINSEPFSFAIVEQPPCIRSVFYNHSEEDLEYFDSTKSIITIPVPWSYWVFQFRMDEKGQAIWNGVVNLYFSDSQAFDLTNKLYSPYTPNVSPADSSSSISQALKSNSGYDLFLSHQVCIGPKFFNSSFNGFSFSDYTRLPLGISGIDFDALFRDYVSYYWSSPFNSDYSDRLEDFFYGLGEYEDCTYAYLLALSDLSIDQVFEKMRSNYHLFTLSEIIESVDKSLPPISLNNIFHIISSSVQQEAIN